jgi:hypothetical protein
MYLGMDIQVRSMGCGLLDSIYDAIHVLSENKLSSSPIPNTTTEVMEIEPPIKENAKSIAKGANDGIEPAPSNLSLYLSISLSLSFSLSLYLSISLSLSLSLSHTHTHTHTHTPMNTHPLMGLSQLFCSHSL